MLVPDILPVILSKHQSTEGITSTKENLWLLPEQIIYSLDALAMPNQRRQNTEDARITHTDYF